MNINAISRRVSYWLELLEDRFDNKVPRHLILRKSRKYFSEDWKYFDNLFYNAQHKLNSTKYKNIFT